MKVKIFIIASMFIITFVNGNSVNGEIEKNISPVCEILFPANYSVVNGIISISGNAYDADGSVESVWIKIGNGSWQEANGTTTWQYEMNTSEYTNGFYDIYAKSYDGTNFSSVSYIAVTVDNFAGSYYLQWSKTYSGRRYEGAQPIGDADNDGENELLVGGTDAVLRVLKWNGTAYSEEAEMTSGYGDNPGGFSIGDVDNDGENEIAVAWDYHFQAFKWNGASYQQIGSTWTGDGADNTYDCFIGDFNNDGENEVILADDPYPGDPEITVLKWDGTDFVEIASWNYPSGNVITPMAWIADVDDDGENEIVCTPGENLVVLDWNGNSFNSTTVDTFSYESYACTCRDLNGDGTPEIAVGLEAPTAYVYEWNGSSYCQIWTQTWSGEDDVIEGIGIGDTNGDGTPELCVGTDKVHILEWNGNSFVQEAILPTEGTLAKVAVGDCDNDGENEINAADVMGYPNKESVWKCMIDTPPICNITYPFNGSMVRGIITINGSVSDLENNTQSVFIRIDDKEWTEATINDGKWSYKWNTTQVGEGWHTICAGASDGERFSSISYEKVMVVNAPFNISLYQGWNFVTIACENNYTASSLYNDIQGCNLILKWNNSKNDFDVYTHGSPNNFAIENGTGYFISVSNNTNLSVTGLPIQSVNITLLVGWNSLGWFKEEQTNASDIYNSIAGCNIVLRWNNSRNDFDVYVPNAPDFVIERGNGFFVSVSQQSQWHG